MEERILSLKVDSIELCKVAWGIRGNKVLEIFNGVDLLTLIEECYEGLHTESHLYLIGWLEDVLKERGVDIDVLKST
ncbi:DUF3791 domain-containing protein [Paenibacillus donghaensis]